MDKNLIAPCGMNCGLCSSYLAEQNDIKKQGIKMPYCSGCRIRGKQCAFLKKRCQLLLEGKLEYCFQCPDFACQNLVKIDRRYRENYRMSMIANLEILRDEGIDKLLEKQNAEWRCPDCGGVVCCHNGICFKCGLEKLRQKTKIYRWEE